LDSHFISSTSIQFSADPLAVAGGF